MHAVICNLSRRIKLITLLCLFEIRVDHALFWAQTYVGGPKRNRNFVIKNCVFIFICYKFNHLQSTVDLMQCTGLNVFFTFRSSPETLAK